MYTLSVPVSIGTAAAGEWENLGLNPLHDQSVSATSGGKLTLENNRFSGFSYKGNFPLKYKGNFKGYCQRIIIVVWTHSHGGKVK